MTGASYGYQKIIGAGEIDGINNIGYAGTSSNKGGPFVVHTIPYQANLVIPLIARGD